VLSLYPQDNLKQQAKIYREQGYKLQSRGELRKALVYYTKAAHLYPQYVEVYNDLGVVYENLGDDKNALAMYKKALAIEANYLPTYTNLAFFYERKGDIKQASYYWQKRYELGEKGEYWWEVSRQHLLKLGTFPEVRKERLEKEAAKLSKELVYKHEQQRLKTVAEARLHFNIGATMVAKGDYAGAIKEFDTALSLNPPDEELKNKIKKLYKKTKKTLIKEEALTYTQEALEYIKRDDFLSAGEKLKNALSSVFRISQKNN
jgi:Flp pilus assembly protein TadD